MNGGLRSDDRTAETERMEGDEAERREDEGSRCSEDVQLPDDGGWGEFRKRWAASPYGRMKAAAIAAGIAWESEVARKAWEFEYWRKLSKEAHADTEDGVEYTAPPIASMSDEGVQSAAIEFRWEGLMGAGSTATIVGQSKTGKTHLALNLARSYLTGEPALGTYAVTRNGRNVLWINCELAPTMAFAWAKEAGVPEGMFIMSTKGMSNPFASRVGRVELVKHLQERDVGLLIVDPFADAFPGDNPDSAGQDRKSVV